MLSSHVLPVNKFHKVCDMSMSGVKLNCTISKFGSAKYLRGHKVKFVSFELSTSLFFKIYKSKNLNIRLKLFGTSLFQRYSNFWGKTVSLNKIKHRTFVARDEEGSMKRQLCNSKYLTLPSDFPLLAFSPWSPQLLSLWLPFILRSTHGQTPCFGFSLI